MVPSEMLELAQPSSILAHVRVSRSSQVPMKDAGVSVGGASDSVSNYSWVRSDLDTKETRPKSKLHLIREARPHLTTRQAVIAKSGRVNSLERCKPPKPTQLHKSTSMQLQIAQAHSISLSQILVVPHRQIGSKHVFVVKIENARDRIEC